MNHRLLVSLEFVFSKKGGDEFPVWTIHDEIRRLRYCADVSEAELIDLLNQLIDKDLYEGPPAEEMKGSSLVWKSCEHPSLDKADEKPIHL